MATTRAETVSIAFAAGGIYLLLAILGLATRFDEGVACLWPAGAWIIALLTILPRRKWFAIFAGCVPASMIATSFFGFGVAAAVPMAVANIGEALLVAVLLDRFHARNDALDSLERLWWFVLAAGIVGPAVSGVLAGAVAWFIGLQFAAQWLQWYAGHALSALALTPVMVLLVSGAASRWLTKATRRQRAECAFLLVLTLAVTVGVFAQSSMPLLFLPILPVVLTTFRVGRVGAAAAVTVVALVGGYATLSGYGPAMLVRGSDVHPIQFFQFFLASTVLTAFPVAADITRRRTVFRELRESEARYRLLTDHSTDIVLNVDRVGRILYVSPSVDQLLGYPPDRLIGTRALHVVDHQDRQAVLQVYREALAGPDGTQIVEYRTRTAAGALRWFEAHTRAVVGDHLTITGIVAVVRDVTRRKKLEEELSRAASTDPLTGLANRRAFDDALAARLNVAKAGAVAGCVAIFDLDHFKRVNDRFGHAVGDRALQAFARIARGIVREDDLVARLGGEEFGVLLPGATLEQAHYICERLRATLAASKLREGEMVINLTVSAGITAIDPDNGAKATLLAADMALYRAKSDGRDRLRLTA